MKERVLQLSPVPVQWLQQGWILRDRNFFPGGGGGGRVPDTTGVQVEERGCYALTHYLIYIIIYTILHLKYKKKIISALSWMHIVAH